MQPQNLDDILDPILAHDPRFQREAYHFIREALDYTQKAICKANKGQVRHITGQELLAGVRAYALAQYGPMALTLLNEWGIHRGEDIGTMVFTLIEANVLSKTEADSPADFAGGYDFQEAFSKPFQPNRRSSETPSPKEPHSN